MRGWREADLALWAAMNADPEVRRYVGPLLAFEQAAAWVLNYQDDLDRYGFGFWAVEIRASGEFIGFTGLNTMDEGMPFSGVGGVVVNCTSSLGAVAAFRVPVTGTMSRVPVPARARLPADTATLFVVPALRRIVAPPATVYTSVPAVADDPMVVVPAWSRRMVPPF